MKKHIVESKLIIVDPGAKMQLTPAQIAPRLKKLKELDGKNRIYEATHQVTFTRGEIITSDNLPGCLNAGLLVKEKKPAEPEE